jgi:hypothetical protein
VEQWAELRRQHFVRGKSIKQLARETGLSRNTVRAALRGKKPPGLSARAGGGGTESVRGRNPPAVARGADGFRGPKVYPGVERDSHPAAVGR